MTQKNSLLILTGLLCGLLLLSCSNTPELEPENAPICFGLDTRAAEGTLPSVGTTYRIMLYTPGQFAFAKKTGTFYLKEVPTQSADGFVELTACDLQDDGTFRQDNPDAGLNGTSGTYDMLYVSPGIKHNDDGSFNINPQEHQKVKFFASVAPTTKNFVAYGRVTSGAAMKECRATVAIDFYKAKSESVQPFSITNLRLIGAGAPNGNVKIYPITRQAIAPKAEELPITFHEATSGQTDTNGNPLYFETSTPVDVASGIYASRSEVAQLLKATNIGNIQESDYLYMACDMTTTDNNETFHVLVPLTSDEKMRELLPQHNYRFKVVVYSTYIAFSVNVFNSNTTNNDWETGGTEEGTIETPDYTVQLGTWKIVGNTWEPIEGIEDQEISSSK